MSTITIMPKHSLTYDGATLNIFHANKGEGLSRHQHLYAHATMCFNGSCVVRKECKEVIMTKKNIPFNLVANEWHEIEALEDGTVFANLFAENKY